MSPELLTSPPTTGVTTEGPGTGHRIGYVLKMYPRFSETFIVSEILAREARGGQIDIFSLRPPIDPRFHDTLARVQAPVTYLRRARKAEELWATLRESSPSLPRLADVLPELLAAEADDAAQAVELASLVLDRGITHLHAHFASVATTVARLTSLLTGVPFSFTAHAKDIFHTEVDPADLYRKIHEADHVVTISRYNYDHLRAQYDAPQDSLHLVHNGLDLDAFGCTVDGDREYVTPPVVTAVGRLVEKKGFSVLIDACRVLVDRGIPIRCRIVGGGALETELRSQVQALGLSDVVELTGPLAQPEVREAVRAAHVLAAPSVVAADGNADGLPTVLLEAMALGTPVVSTDVTGLTEAVRDGETGLVVEQHDAEGLADALHRLLSEPDLRAELSSRARELIEDTFDSRGQAAALDSLLPAVIRTGAHR